VKDITFSDSVMADGDNAIRIKSNSGKTGLIQGYVAARYRLSNRGRITFKNIRIENALKYGIVIQQDYLNGGPTGTSSRRSLGLTVQENQQAASRSQT
jgi:polygalacturonase